jgi:hypothetical protein
MDDKTAYELNRELSRRILQEVQSDPSSPYAGNVFGIANGQVVLVGDDPDTTHRRLLEIEPDTWRCATFEPSRVEHV